jgi:polar amino acid transport system substrate-binding protein
MKWFTMQTFWLLYFGLLPISFSIASEVHLDVVTENWRPYNFEEEGQIKGTSTTIVKKSSRNPA